MVPIVIPYFPNLKYLFYYDSIQLQLQMKLEFMNSPAIFWDVVPCGQTKVYQHFKGS